MTTELIKELVGLAVEKGIRFEYEKDTRFIGSWFTVYPIRTPFSVYLEDDYAPAQLQAAIDRIKSL